MSGHSKWSTIHRQKEVADQKRGQVFTKLAKAIIVAVRDSGGITDPERNFKLRLVMEKAKAANMPKENVERAIDRAVGKGEGEGVVEITYEGYGPAGVGILVEAATDNKQRTVQEVKNVFDKNGGSIASPGAVSFNFQKSGLIVVETGKDKQKAILKIIDLGAEEVEEAEAGVVEVYVGLDRLEEMKNKLSQEAFIIRTAEIVQKPINLVPVTDEKTASQVLRLMDKLQALDDVQRVFANFDIPQELLTEKS
ncbi:MAG TPA: YebC/PmpR family DNA-binding transcriptional regulator [Clostridia bacterium]|nr:YebC/PmpR family DNA-binding transcriptional regulator [Clostridia bacterium]